MATDHTVPLRSRVTESFDQWCVPYIVRRDRMSYNPTYERVVPLAYCLIVTPALRFLHWAILGCRVALVSSLGALAGVVMLNIRSQPHRPYNIPDGLWSARRRNFERSATPLGQWRLAATDRTRAVLSRYIPSSFNYICATSDPPSLATSSPKSTNFVRD